MHQNKELAAVAQETLDIFEGKKEYPLTDRAWFQEICRKTEAILYTNFNAPMNEPSYTNTIFSVIPSSIIPLLNVRAKQDYNKVGVLCLANHKKPGDEFLTGSNTQEEALCRSSNLYFALKQPAVNTFYAENLDWRNGDSIVYCKDVVFIRNKKGILTDYYVADVLACTAVDLPDDLTNEKVFETEEILRRRIRNIIYAFIQNECKAIILSAWGYGLLRKNPDLVAKCFYDVLITENLYKYFGEVLFSTVGRTSASYIAFSKKFAYFLPERKSANP